MQIWQLSIIMQWPGLIGKEEGWNTEVMY